MASVNIPTKKKAGKKAVASKQTLNLAFHESNFHPTTLIPVIAVVIVAALAFAKFGFLDQLDKKTAALNQLAEKQDQYSAFTTKLMGYDELAAKYGRYSYGWMTETESSLVGRMEVLDILENTVNPVSAIEDFTINNNVVACNISGITLDATSKLVDALEANPLVKSVSVYKATAEESVDAQVAMTIILQKEVQENG